MQQLKEVARRNDLTLQQASDPEDALANSFKIDRYQITYRAQPNPILNIDIYNDVNDYAVYWKWSGSIFVTTLVSAAVAANRTILKRAGDARIAPPISVTASIFLPSGSKDEVLSLPSAEPYLDELAQQGMTFLRLDMPYYDVWADLVPQSGTKPEKSGEVGWTSFHNVSDEIATFFGQTIGTAETTLTKEPLNLTRLADLLSIALNRFERF
jgi:hypothetical protein